MADHDVPQRLALLAYQLLYPDLFTEAGTSQFDAIRLRTDDLWENRLDLRSLLRTVRRDVTDPRTANTGALQEALIWALAEPALFALVAEFSLDGPLIPEDIDEEVRLAAARIAIGAPDRSDRRRVRSWARTLAAQPPPDPRDEEPTDHEDEKGADMAKDEIWGPYEGEYRVDLRNTPENFDEETFREEINRLFALRNADKGHLGRAHQAYVAGSLLRASYFDPDVPGFADVFVDFYNEGFENVTIVVDGKESVDPKRRNIEVYGGVAHQISTLKNNDVPTWQEVSAVTDIVLDSGPVNDNFASKCRSALDDVVGKGFDYDSLDLPDIVTDETAQAEIEPGNVRSVAMVYAASNLEFAGLFSTCEQASMDWSDGVLPVGENAGRLFDDFVFNARERLDPAARDIQFQRIEGLHGHLLRFCSAASERDPQHVLERVSGRPQAVSPAAGRRSAQDRGDLLAYASLHGWAYTQFAAKRLGNQIRQCIEIIDHAEVQKAYGVSGPWQVVERVSVMTGTPTPDIQKSRALAATGKSIVDMLASKAKAIGASLASTPLFPPATGGNLAVNGDRPERSVFSRDEYEVLMNHVENWLAANTVSDQQRFEESQLRESAPSASLPSFGSSGAGGGVDSEAVKNQLMQMVSAGQMPTADQVEQLFNLGI